MLYKLNFARLSLGEIRNNCPAWQLPVVLLLKLLHITPGAEVIPDSWAPYRVEWEGIPEEVRSKLAPYLQQMLECGFSDPVFAWFSNPVATMQICSIAFRHHSRAHIGSISLTLSGPPKARKESVELNVTAAYTDGSAFITTNLKKKFVEAPTVKYQRLVDASIPELYQAHCRELRAASAGKKIIPVDSPETLEKTDDEIMRAYCEFHAGRGVLVPCEEQERKAIESALAVSGTDEDKKFAAVYQEIEHAAKNKSSILGGIVILIATVLAFMALGTKELNAKVLLLTVGVLFFHEAGHFIAMKLFGYRNVRMFFIPFFGAAVTGKNYNVAGWKKCLVSFAGPLPGIVLGFVLGISSIMFGWPELGKAALFMMILNAFNLLPIMPLDGGQIMHATIFSRHPIMDVVFRLTAAAALFCGAFYFQTKALGFVGFAMLASIPSTFGVAKAVRSLRKRGFKADSPDACTVPFNAAKVIHGEIRTALPSVSSSKTLAQLTLSAFESLNAKPPGILASLAILCLHAASLVGVLIAVAVMFIVQNGGLFRILALREPAHDVRISEILDWRGAEYSPLAESAKLTVVADFKKRAPAQLAFQEITPTLPKRASATLFGDTLIVALPTSDQDAREALLTNLKARTKAILVSTGGELTGFTISGKLPTPAIAKELSEQADAFFSLNDIPNLTPPWHPDLLVSEEQAKARKTLIEIRNFNDVAKDSRWQELQKTAFEASRLHDERELKRIYEESKNLTTENFKNKIAQLREEGDAKWDLGVVDFYEKNPEPGFEDRYSINLSQNEDEAETESSVKKAAKQRREWAAKIGPRFGQTPDSAVKLEAEEDRFAGIWGTPLLNGPTFKCALSLKSASDDAITFAKWLERNGAANLKYEFEVGTAED